MATFHQTEKRVDMKCRGQQAIKHSQGYRALTSPPPLPLPPPLPPPQKHPANALEAAPRRGFLLSLLPRALVCACRSRRCGGTNWENGSAFSLAPARVTPPARPAARARRGQHGTTKTAAVLVRRADQATARTSTNTEFTGPWLLRPVRPHGPGGKKKTAGRAGHM